MSILDTIGSLFGKSSPEGGGQPALIAAALEWINSHPGGLNGLVQKFQENGAGETIQSWISNGENQPISSEKINQVLGSDAVSGLAQKAGIEPNQASGMLAQVLPHVVNAATPNGTMPAEGKVNAESVLGALGGLSALFGKKSNKTDS
jgi:uncharacterized protein YidB (DUF937 family)